MNNLVTKASELIYQMDNDQLNQVIEAIKLKRTHLARQITRSVMVGDIVSFEGRGGKTVTGKVMKVNPKTLLVQDSQTMTRWKVTASLVTPLSIGA
jgi:putative ribosome biogenesis GTPase RsgA